ncbi:MAG: NAD-dependent epimerase/dehydratase family protein [Prevotellaceae bacterium]|jgi:nucleoside-diphosphate-sugar epimerase|nr:NAD-dependent epimerase/dehydratase family protein [Prevotellaceae bacterium]
MHPNKIILADLRRIASADVDWQQLAGKTVLVTGASGFLPAYMVETLLYLAREKIVRGLKVLALVRNREKAEKRFAHLLSDSRLQLIVQDVCLPLKVDEPVHFIVHAASQASPKYYGVDPVGTLSANVSGTLNLCELARKNPLQSFLYFSSGEVYGKVDDRLTEVTESDYGYLDPMNVRSCYGESKRMGETICVSYMHQFGIPVKIVRPGHTYGPGMELNDGRVFADFVRNIVNGEDIVMNSDGSASRAFCYLSDATVAFFKVLIAGKAGEAYNVANPFCEVTIGELAKKLTDMFPEKRLKVVRRERATSGGYMASKNTRCFASIKKMQSLSWSPSVTIEEGFYKTILSYK